MSDRAVTALGAAAALLVLGLLTFQGGNATPATRPTSEEAGRNGYAALARWLSAEEIPVRSLRVRMDGLRGVALHIPPSGNLLITTMPHRHRLRRDEGRTLWRWIGDGNTVLIMAALDDTPDWSLEVDSSTFLDDLARLTGLHLHQSSAEDVPELTGSAVAVTTVHLEALDAHPLMAGVGSLEGESDFLTSLWEADRQEGDDRAILQLARETRYGVPAMWQVRIGDGHVVVSALGSALTNRAVGAAGNRTFVHNLLRRHLGPGGAVIFDDMHQGLTTLYDPDAFFRDPRLGGTVLFVLGFWALYLLGTGSRLAPLRTMRETPGQADFVSGVGGFLARKLSRSEAGGLMMDGWLEELRHRGLVAKGTGPPWEALESLSALDGGAVARLRAHHDALARGANVDLREVHNTIEELRRMLR